MKMILANVACIVVLAGAGFVHHRFVDESRKSDAYMRAEIERNTRPPALRPLHYHHHHYVYRVKDTAKNRARHTSWVIDPGDGYLYSAWWE